MGWFDEQIRQRMESDRNLFDDSFVRVAASVLGGRVADLMRDRMTIAREALDDILKYYRCAPVKVPDSIQTAEEQMDYVLRPLGIMTRAIRLEPGWQKDAFGPMIGFLKDGNDPVALLPNLLHG